jgi:sugar lactone lactonase YvrE
MNVLNAYAPVSFLLLIACSSPSSARGPAGNVIDLPGPTFYPEGIAFDDAGNMYVSSILTGALVRVASGGIEADEWVAPGVLGTSLVGITMSQSGDLLWACVGTFGSDASPALVGVAVDGATEVVRHAFPPQADGATRGLCNEITEDLEGNVYVSDSFGARILRVPAISRRAPDSAVEWARSPLLAAVMFGVNGIAFDGVDAILAVNTEAGTMVRVRTADASIEPVTLSRALTGPDGLRVWDGRAVIVEGGSGAVSAVELTSGAVTVLRHGLREPTSLDVIDGSAWVAEGQLSHLFTMSAPELPFQAHRVTIR